MSDIILRTLDLTKQYKNRLAVDHLNIEVRQGDIFGFLGPNGAGKSTTIRMILHLIFPTHGDVEIFGVSLKKAIILIRSELLRLEDSYADHFRLRIA